MCMEPLTFSGFSASMWSVPLLFTPWFSHTTRTSTWLLVEVTTVSVHFFQSSLKVSPRSSFSLVRQFLCFTKEAATPAAANATPCVATASGATTAPAKASATQAKPSPAIARTAAVQQTPATAVTKAALKQPASTAPAAKKPAVAPATKKPAAAPATASSSGGAQ